MPLPTFIIGGPNPTLCIRPTSPSSSSSFISFRKWIRPPPSSNVSTTTGRRYRNNLGADLSGGVGGIVAPDLKRKSGIKNTRPTHQRKEEEEEEEEIYEAYCWDI